MKLDQLILDTEIQSEYKIVYYDYEEEEIKNRFPGIETYTQRI